MPRSLSEKSSANTVTFASASWLRQEILAFLRAAKTPFWIKNTVTSWPCRLRSAAASAANPASRESKGSRDWMNTYFAMPAHLHFLHLKILFLKTESFESDAVRPRRACGKRGVE